MKKTNLNFAALMLIAALFIVSSFAFNKAKPSAESRFFYVVSWVSSCNGKSRPVVSNVVRVDCKYYSSIGVQNMFTDFFKAFHLKKTGCTLYENNTAPQFETFDQAEAARRKRIADFNDWDVYLVKDFTPTCN